jgi:hypothetical protein
MYGEMRTPRTSMSPPIVRHARLRKSFFFFYNRTSFFLLAAASILFVGSSCNVSSYPLPLTLVWGLNNKLEGRENQTREGLNHC